MTGVIFFDSVGLHASAAELPNIYSKAGTPGSGYSPVLTQHGRNSGKSFRASDRRGASHIQRTIAPRHKIGAHFAMRIQTSVVESGGCGFFVAGSAARLNIWSTAVTVAPTATSTTAPADLVTLSIGAGGALVVEHAVQTGSSSSSLNRLLLSGAGFTFQPGVLYAIEILADFSQSVATIEVWIDGVQVLDASLNRDRLSSTLPGILLDTFEYVSLGGASGVTNTDTGNPHFSDIVVYDPDLRPGPIGPVAVNFYPADNAAFSGSPDDATRVQIPGVTLSSFDVEGMPTSGEIISAYIAARSLPSIADQIYTLELRANTPAGPAEFTHLTGPMSGGSARLTRERIPGVDDFADLVGMSLKARSRA
jgi:hypothetical protein